MADNFLTRKVAGLPFAVWLLILTAAAGGFWWYSRRQQQKQRPSR